MTEKKIENPLRTIVLNYDERITETDYEKKLLNDYIALHQTAYRLKLMMHKLHYEYTEWNDKIPVAEEAFRPLKDKVNDLFTLSQAMIPGIERKAEAGIFREKIIDTYADVLLFHQTHLVALDAEIEKLEKDYKAFTALDEQFDNELENFDEKTTSDLYTNYNDYALDMATFDDDMDLFRDAIPDVQLMYDAQATMVDNYNLFMASVKKTYDQWEQIKEI